MIKKVNILYIIDTLEKVGGTERHLLELAKNLNKELFDCTVCVLNENTGCIAKEIEKSNIAVMVIPVKKIYNFNAFRQALKIIKLIKEKHIDIVQTFHFKADIYGGIISKVSRVPILISSRRDLNNWQNRTALLFLSRIVNRFFNKFIAVSGDVKNLTIHDEWVRPSKIVTINNGVDLERFHPYGQEENMRIRRHLNINMGDCIIGCIANLREDKNYDVFLKAIAKLASVKKDIKCLIVGDGPLRKMLNSLSDELGISSCVIFTGYREDIPDILSIMDIFCLVSKKEGFSNAVLEAMAMARPIVATKVGGNKEAVVEQETGILVPHDDAGKMADAILELCNDVALREKMGLAGRKRIESVFTLERMIKEMEELYLGLLNNAWRHG
jgi:glycosyltransferase involved in cell wall biosynthesis